MGLGCSEKCGKTHEISRVGEILLKEEVVGGTEGGFD